MPTRAFIFGLVAVCLLPAARTRAEFITVTPGSSPSAPTLVLSTGEVRAGFVVPEGKRVIDQYAPGGIRFETGGLGPSRPVAVGPVTYEVGPGTTATATAWLPIGSRFPTLPGESDPSENQLNFSHGYNAVVGLRFVSPDGAGPVVVKSVSVELVGVEPGLAGLVLIAGDRPWAFHTPMGGRARAGRANGDRVGRDRGRDRRTRDLRAPDPGPDGERAAVGRVVDHV
jgi:hypothetical protein